MTTKITFTVDLGNLGNATSQDKDAAVGVVSAENAKIEDYNAQNPDDPLPLWPMSPNQALLDSYEKIWGTVICPDAHNSYADQFAQFQADQSEIKERWKISSDEQKEAAVNELEPLPETASAEQLPEQASQTAKDKNK